MSVVLTPEPRALDMRAGDVNLRYYLWDSDGPTAVMLHPSRGYARVWDGVVPYLFPHYRIISVDQRGHGDSDRPATGYAGEDFAQDLERLLDKLGVDRVTLVTHSLGGRAAQIFAGNHPERVAKLAIVGGPHAECFYATPEQFAANRRTVETARRSPQRFASAALAHEHMCRSSPWQELNDQQREHVIRYNMNRESNGGVSFKYDNQSVAEGLSHMTDDLHKYVRHITCPVLFVIRLQGHDAMTNEVAEKLAGYFVNAKVKIVYVDGVHFAQLENPAAVGTELRAFLLPI